jgi:hypothetical protein
MHGHEAASMRLVARVLNFSLPTFTTVIPAKAGIPLAFLFAMALWIPACAGMTVLSSLVIESSK